MNLDIYSTRLHFRRFRQSDITNFIQYRNDPNVIRYQSWEPITTPEAQAFIDEAIATPMISPTGQIAIALRDTDELIGECYIHINYPEQAELSLGLMQQYHRSGFGKEILLTLLDFAYNTLHLHRTYGYMACDNVGQIALLEKTGHRYEGRTRLSFCYKGVWRDDYQYAMLRSEYIALYMTS